MLKTSFITILLLFTTAHLYAERLLVKMIDGIPCAQFIVSNGNNTLRCHLLIDPGYSGSLLLCSEASAELELQQETKLIAAHQNGRLIGLDCVIADIDGLDELSRQWSASLNEIPLWGILGSAAFASDVFVVNLADGYIEYGIDFEVPDTAVLNLYKNTDGRWFTEILLAPDYTGSAIVSFSDNDTAVDSDSAALAGHENGDLTEAVAGEVKLRHYTAIRVTESLSNDTDMADIVLANSFWQNFPVYFDLINSRLLLDVANGRVISDPGRQRLFSAMALGDIPVILDYLKSCKDSRLTAESLKFVLELSINSDNRQQIDIALEGLSSVLPSERAIRFLLEYAINSVSDKNNDLAQRFIDQCRTVLMQNDDQPYLHCQVNTVAARIALEKNDMVQARRDLFAALYLLPGDGQANFFMGKYYQLNGQPLRAWARYLNSALASEPVDGAVTAMLELQQTKLHDSLTVELICDLLDGRIFDDEGNLTDQAGLLKAAGGELVRKAITDLQEQIK